MTHQITLAQGWTPSRRHLIASAGAALAAPWIGANAQGKIAGGKLRPLAVTSLLRARSLPEVPTMAEAGVNNPVAQYST